MDNLFVRLVLLRRLNRLGFGLNGLFSLADRVWTLLLSLRVVSLGLTLRCTLTIVMEVFGVRRSLIVVRGAVRTLKVWIRFCFKVLLT